MLVILILLVPIAIAVVFALRTRNGPRILLIIGGVVVLSIAGLWIYDILRRPYMVAHWLNLKEPPESLSVQDCKDAGLLTDVDSNCLVTIDPQHFRDLLAGYEYQHHPGSASEVSLATGVRKFEVTDSYMVTPSTFKYGGAVTIYTNARRDRAIINLYIE